MHLYWKLNPPLLPIDFANGEFRNPCCMPVILKNGEMRFSGSGLAEYKVMYDKIGPYIHTKRFIGVDRNRVYGESGDNAIMTRLEIRGNCKILDLHSPRGNKSTLRFSTC